MKNIERPGMKWSERYMDNDKYKKCRKRRK